MVIPYLVLVGLVGAERLVELVISQRNARWALDRGGVELGQRHFAVMKVLHTGFLFACAAEVVLLDRPFLPALGWPMLALTVGAQALRYWAIASLGRQWNVRVLVVPRSEVVVRGPYRFMRHPNYLAVIVEGAALPLVHTAWLTAVVFSALNAVLLLVRIRCEEDALTRHCAYRDRLGRRRRFLPTGPGEGRA